MGKSKECCECEEKEVSTKRKSHTGLIVVLVGCVCLVCGILLGIHWRVIKALIQGDELPKVPDWHIWCRSKED